MSTLHQLWKQYNDNPDDEVISDVLCKRVRKFARIVLRRVKIGYTTVIYEDLMQLAFLCFFKIAPVYKEGSGSLEGYFIYSFTNEVSEFIKSSNFIWYKHADNIPDVAQNPLESMIFEELNKEVEDLLSFEELNLLNTYLKEGIYDLSYIAKEEHTTEEDVKWTITAVQDKITKYLDKEYGHYKGK